MTAISQGTTTTAFSYDALGRRVNETANGLTTVRHYTDSSDNPEWTSQLNGTLLTTEIYTGSLGAGLGVTSNLKGTTKTQTMQLTDLKGHVVANYNLATSSVSSWSTYDSFGNPQTSQTNTNLLNYSSYGQQERATNTTGLILMGARVYNPETNQFTSKDPIPGGNENSYTYPNDPINGSDLSGCWGWDETFMVLSIAVMFVPVAGEVAMAAQAVRMTAIVVRAAVIESRAQRLLMLVREKELQVLAKGALTKQHNVTVESKFSKSVVDKAGELFTKSTDRVPHGKGLSGFKLQSEEGRSLYRSPAYKEDRAEYQANFQSYNTRPFKGDYKINVHVNVRKWP